MFYRIKTALYIHENRDLGHIIVGFGRDCTYYAAHSRGECVAARGALCVCVDVYTYGFFFEINSVFVSENCRVNRCYLSNEST